MRKRKKKLNKIFNKFCKIKYLYQIQTQAMLYCCENYIDCSHIRELSDIIENELHHTINELDLFVLKL